jgi:4-aminobutyrate aminotransferase-like enzyme
MDAWGASKGEALHTQTFLGHPVGCAAGNAILAQLPTLTEACATLGARLRSQLEDRGYAVRGRGLMLGVELGDISFPVARALQRRGFVVLPSGMRAEVLCLTPPSCLTDAQVGAFLDALDASVVEVR